MFLFNFKPTNIYINRLFFDDSNMSDATSLVPPDVEKGIPHEEDGTYQPPLESDVDHVLLAFKCCVEDCDHILNKLAVKVTAVKKNRNNEALGCSSNDAEFRGRISHVEILIKQRPTEALESHWHRYSIMKQVGRYVGTRVVYSPGTVHSIKTSFEQMKNYRFYRLIIGIDGVNRALTFLDQQVRRKAPFNLMGYMFNFTSPMLFGVSHYEQAEKKTENKWFCTELIVCALQAGGVRSFAPRKACALSPNDLYDIIVTEPMCTLVYSGNYLIANS